MPESLPSLLKFLQELFRVHGVKGSLDGDWLRLPRPHVRVKAKVVSEQQHPKTIVIQLDVVFEVDFGRVIVESFGGWAENRTDAVGSALEAFTNGVFHAWLHAFFGIKSNHASVEKWTAGGTVRQCIIGPAIVKGTGSQPAKFDTSWWNDFKAHLEAADLSDGVHWARFYYARLKNEPPTLEVASR